MLAIPNNIPMPVTLISVILIHVIAPGLTPGDIGGIVLVTSGWNRVVSIVNIHSVSIVNGLRPDTGNVLPVMTPVTTPVIIPPTILVPVLFTIPPPR
jgi:hypothetical protein